ncbi:nucleoside phosphorylase domain-containing protein [Xylogone sp. PMI_703]|nr:nucleoside phosphorylase domain-containing protein [Xylogone sp. PMI_703]
MNTISIQEYQVAVVCALPHEMTAARAMLDQEHPPLRSKDAQDHNSYVLGHAHGHNIVIACLPAGVYGTNAAAMVARDLLRTFTGIRFGLMLGIGGGIPNLRENRDIRLGDVVVSQPEGIFAGVVQYDLGKSLDGKFERKGSLNRPPTVLLTALSRLQSEYSINGGNILMNLEQMFENHPNLKNDGYAFPGVDADQLHCSQCDLYKWWWVFWVVMVWLWPLWRCEVCEHGLARRSPRNFTNPKVFFGTIASGNQVIKDVKLRDRLGNEYKALCVEMEAAGLMDDFPCIVIRGICDYADSHKNDLWQGYAAMAAAAYAKDLLSQIQPTEVEKEAKAVDMIFQELSQLHDTVRSLDDEYKKDKIRQWLQSSNPSMNYDKALEQRQSGTGRWVLEHIKFVRWKTQPNSFLWLHGIAGCGKTILSSTILENLQSTQYLSSVIYFYFDFNDVGKQSLESMLRSLINQLYNQQEAARAPVDALFPPHSNPEEPTCDLLHETLLKMMTLAKEVWIILDALDECTTRKGSATTGVLSWIEEILASERFNIHILCTSRPERDIESAVGRWSSFKDQIPIQSELISDDTDTYIKTRVRCSDGLKKWRNRTNVLELIEKNLNNKANGMFRLVACQLDAIEECLDLPTLRKALNDLPDTLYKMYTDILHKIPSAYRFNAIRILQFLVFSERPLQIEEVVDMLAVDVNNSKFDPDDRMPDPQEISRYCSSLVVVVSQKEGSRSGNDQLQLAHFSVKEYLTSDKIDKDIAKDFQESTALTTLLT